MLNYSIFEVGTDEGQIKGVFFLSVPAVTYSFNYKNKATLGVGDRWDRWSG